jgi:hypothetical protein
MGVRAGRRAAEECEKDLCGTVRGRWQCEDLEGGTNLRDLAMEGPRAANRCSLTYEIGEN